VRRGTVAILAVLVTVTGCGTDSDSAADFDETITVKVPAETNPRTLKLPLDAYRIAKEDQSVLDQAVATDINACMRTFGFDFHSQWKSTGFYFLANSRRYYSYDLKTAQVNGYHPAKELLAQQAGLGKNIPSAAERAVLIGEGEGEGERGGKAIPAGGCQGQALKETLKGAKAKPNTSLVDQLSGQTFERSQQHKQVVAAFARWSTCMKKAGFRYRTPRDANNDQTFNTDAPSQLEINTAVADVTCKKKEKVIETWSAVEIAYQDQAIEKNITALSEIRDSLDVQVKNASAAIGR
jgi:hypothetical protein